MENKKCDPIYYFIIRQKPNITTLTQTNILFFELFDVV